MAAVIAEPSRAMPYLPPPGFWAEVRAACDATGTPLIFDEIPTGLGKTGHFFAHEPSGAVPDMVVLGGAALPIAAVIVRDGLDTAADRAIGHHTHEKNPLLARAALTTIDIIDEEGLVERARDLGRYALDRLRESTESLPGVIEVRGAGLLLGIELEDPGRAEAVLYDCPRDGLGFKVTMGRVSTLSPPLTSRPPNWTRP